MDQGHRPAAPRLLDERLNQAATLGAAAHEVARRRGDLLRGGDAVGGQVDGLNVATNHWPIDVSLAMKMHAAL